MAYNPCYKDIGTAFVEHFYTIFDTPDENARTAGLENLYDVENSILTFEDVTVFGKKDILEKFASLHFTYIQHRITKIDSQPLADGSITVCVMGQLKSDDDPERSFIHSFILKPNGASFYISNEIFRLVIH